MPEAWSEPGAGLPDPPPGITPEQWIRAVAITAAAGVHIQEHGGSYSGSGESRRRAHEAIESAAERWATFIAEGRMPR